MAPILEYTLILDIEATCEENKSYKFNNEVIELGCVLVDNKKLKVVDTYRTFVKPEQSEVNAFCTRLTGIKPEDVATIGPGVMTFQQAMAWLHGVAKGKTWASWGDYDREQIRRQCSSTGASYPFGQTHVNIKALFGIMEGLNRGTGMPEALEYYGLSLDGDHHRALPDAQNIARIYLEILKRYRKEESKNV